MSNLGALIMWKGKKDGKEGIFCWFFDIVMHNTTSQKAKDLMPGIELVMQQLDSEEFIKIRGHHDEVILISDNALSSPSLTPFIKLLNETNRIKIIRWINNEAQRGKDFLGENSYIVHTRIEWFEFLPNPLCFVFL